MSGVSNRDERAELRSLVMAEALRDVPSAARIVLWGAGGAGQRFYPSVKDRISMVVDSAPDSAVIGRIAVVEPSALIHERPDVILVATDAVAEVSQWVTSHIHPLPRIIDLQRSLPWHCTSIDSSSDCAPRVLSRLSELGTIRVLEDICTPEQVVVLASPSGAIALHEHRGDLMSSDGPSIRVFIDRSVGLNKQGSILPVALAQGLLYGMTGDQADAKPLPELGHFLRDAAAVYRERGIAVRECESNRAKDSDVSGASSSTPGFLS